MGRRISLLLRGCRGSFETNTSNEIITLIPNCLTFIFSHGSETKSEKAANQYKLYTIDRTQANANRLFRSVHSLDTPPRIPHHGEFSPLPPSVEMIPMTAVATPSLSSTYPVVFFLSLAMAAWVNFVNTVLFVSRRKNIDVQKLFPQEPCYFPYKALLNQSIHICGRH